MSESKTPCKHGAITTWMTDDGMPTMWSCVACNHKFVPIAQLLQAEAERDALAARVAELEKDARRYRWLRENPETDDIYGRMGAELDYAVDAALSREEES